MNLESLMTSFAKWVVRLRWVILLLVLLITIGFVSATKHLTVNNDYDSWLPSNDRVTELYRLVDDQFGANALVFAVLDFTEKGTFDPESLALVQRMTDALEAIDELFNVSSLTNIVDIRKTEYGVEVGDLIPEIPQSSAELAELEAYVLSKEMYVNTLIPPMRSTRSWWPISKEGSMRGWRPIRSWKRSRKWPEITHTISAAIPRSSSTWTCTWPRTWLCWSPSCWS
jgi:predicted RND superfamily exporter protein